MRVLPRRIARPKPSAIVLIGVSGSGKSTVGRQLAAVLGATFLEGDAYHATAAIAKMRSGIPLTDLDRWPWLATIAGVIARHCREGRAVVVACSALKRAYRDKLQTIARTRLTFIHLALDPGRLDRRLQARRGHFMPSVLLASQLAALEPLGADEHGTTILATGTTRRTVATIKRWLTFKVGRDNGLRPRKRVARGHPIS